ncbi:MAG TPA: hypothetical protein VK564_02265, partial [Thermodesulfobacteriota bacterium]|nr:hypothetical protein [Thermodesulfobacteriota bacterium]
MILAKKERYSHPLLILFGSLLLILSFPKFSCSFLAWIALVPFFKLIENHSSGKRFRLGYIFGLVYSLGVFYWVTHSMHYYGGLDPFTSFGVLVMMVAYLALYTGAFAWAWGLIPPRGILSLFWAPSLWVILEFLRAFLLTGFPWELLGYSQYNFPLVAQSAEWTGVYGVSFLIVLVNQALYQIFLVKPSCHVSDMTPRRAKTGTEDSRPHFSIKEPEAVGKWKTAVLTLVMLGGTLVFGWQALDKQKMQDLKSLS